MIPTNLPIGEISYNGVVMPIAGRIQVEELEVNENGVITAPAGHAYSPVVVNVQPELEEKNVTITENGTTDELIDQPEN